MATLYELPQFQLGMMDGTFHSGISQGICHPTIYDVTSGQEIPDGQHSIRPNVFNDHDQ